jgi:hypothetical protein
MLKRDTIVKGSHRSVQKFAHLFEQPAQFTAANIARWAQLASVLEPVVHTPGKTTRAGDCSPEQRFAYFLTAGVNIGEAFRDVGSRCLKARNLNTGQPLLYDAVLKAQIDSKAQRDGGRTNQGIIEMLMPTVAAQALYLSEPPGPHNIDDTFANVRRVMQQTTQEDVGHLAFCAEVAWAMGGEPMPAVTPQATTVYGYYQERAKEFDWPVFGEFLGGFKTAHAIVKTVLRAQAHYGRHMTFQEVVAGACAQVQKTLPRWYYPGQMADDTAVALYVLFSHHANDEVVF